jgi:hypothetical protein
VAAKRGVSILVLLLGLVVFTFGCNKNGADPSSPGGGDEQIDPTLPDGFVVVDRPPNPPTSFTMPCPLGEIPSPPDNPYFVSDGFPEGIPAVDEPKFVSVDKAAPTMDANERIIAVERGGLVKGIPVRILIHHELVNLCWNDAGGEHYSFLTYCPLVDGAMHFTHDFPCFDPAAKKGKSFGVSGFLYNGNLVMYARNTDDPQTGTPPLLYSQLYGGGVEGTCTEVEPVMFDMTFTMFQTLFPGALVMSDDTGFMPDGGYDYYDHPYTDYWRSNDIFFPVSHEDGRLMRKVPVYGVITPTGAKAYYTIGTMYVRNDDIGGTKVVVWNDPAFGSTAAFEPVAAGRHLTFSFAGREKHGLPIFKDEETGSLWTFDGIAVGGPLEGERLPHLTALRVFWFAWAAFYPDTELYVP